MSDVKVDALRAELPHWAQEVGVEVGELSIQSLTLAVDAGFYLADVFLAELTGRVRWGLGTKRSDGCLNRPVLLGLGSIPLMPYDIVINCMWGVLRGNRDEQRLVRIYDFWVRWHIRQKSRGKR